MTDLDRLRQQAQDAIPGLGRLTSAIPVRPSTIIALLDRLEAAEAALARASDIHRPRHPTDPTYACADCDLPTT